MQFLDLTLPTPEENLALDEALLLAAEADGRAEFLRLWESPRQFVVLGKNCRVADDVRVEQCEADGVPILRRSSGGGTVLVGPGCLNFAVVLRYDRAPGLTSVNTATAFVLERVREAVSAFDRRVQLAGTSDLVIGDRKFCGNAQRRQRTHFLHHGSILQQFDFGLMARYLKEPRRQPAYRAVRCHESFLRNLAVAPEQLRGSLRKLWHAEEEPTPWPQSLVAHLVKERYGQASWTFRF